MAIKLVSCIGNKDLCRKFKKLYIKSFPAEERAPYLLLLNRAKKGKADMFCAISGDEFMGIFYMLSDEDKENYSSIEEQKRIITDYDNLEFCYLPSFVRDSVLYFDQRYLSMYLNQNHFEQFVVQNVFDGFQLRF